MSDICYNVTNDCGEFIESFDEKCKAIEYCKSALKNPSYEAGSRLIISKDILAVVKQETPFLVENIEP